MSGTISDTQKWHDEMGTILDEIHTKWLLNQPAIVELDKKHNMTKYFAEHFIEMFYSADPKSEFKQPYNKNPTFSCLSFLCCLIDQERMRDWLDTEMDTMIMFDTQHECYDQFKTALLDSIDWRVFVAIVYHVVEKWLYDQQVKLAEFVEKRDDIIAEINAVKQQIKSN